MQTVTDGNIVGYQGTGTGRRKTGSGSLPTFFEVNLTPFLDMWGDGGAGKTILHGLVGAATAALGNGNTLGGALGAAASEKASSAMHDYLIAHGYEEGSPAYNSMMQLGSAAVGGAIGGGAGANTGLAGDSFNRQLHPNEIKLITGELAAKYAAEHPGVSERDAETLLMAQALRQVDDGWANKLEANSTDGLKLLDGTLVQDHADVQQWLANNTPAWATQEGYFTATAAERADPTINGQYYDAAFHKQWNGIVSDLVSGITGSDETPAQHGSQVNFGGYIDMANSLRDQGRLMVLEQEVRSGQTLTDSELYEYQKLAVLYPMLQTGALGPAGQLGLAIRDNDPTSAAMAVIGAIPGEGVAATAGKLADTAIDDATRLAINSARGRAFQSDALSALGVTENTTRYTVDIGGGQMATVIPDAYGTTIIEVKDVLNISNSTQFKAYAQMTSSPRQVRHELENSAVGLEVNRAANSAGGTSPSDECVRK